MQNNFVSFATDKNRLVTSSLGGMTVIELANRHTGAVIERLVLPAGAVVPDGDATVEKIKTNLRALHDGVLAHYNAHHHLLPVPRSFLGLDDAEGAARAADALIDQLTRELAACRAQSERGRLPAPVVTVAPAPAVVPPAKKGRGGRGGETVPLPSGLRVDAAMLGLADGRAIDEETE